MPNHPDFSFTVADFAALHCIGLVAAMAYVALTALAWAVMSGRITLKNSAQNIEQEGGE